MERPSARRNKVLVNRGVASCRWDVLRRMAPGWGCGLPHSGRAWGNPDLLMTEKRRRRRGIYSLAVRVKMKNFNF